MHPAGRAALLLAILASCGADAPPGSPASPRAAVVDRDTWWNRATQLSSSRERILAPRELRALLAEGRERGYSADAAWWHQRREWAYGRILEVDPEDVEANAGMGRKTLQSIEGFAELWERMIDTRVPTARITELLDRYGPEVLEGRPVFLTAEEYELDKAWLREAAEHLDRVANDARYAALQQALRQVRTSYLSDYPYLHVEAGPFLVFYSARDLQRDPLGDPAAEDARLRERHEFYRRRLEKWVGVYGELVDDLAALYPDAWPRLAPAPGTVLPQWVFSEPSWYQEFRRRVHRDEEDQPYRRGFLQPETNWAFLLEPTESSAHEMGADDPDLVLRETAAYLAVGQLLRRWAQDPRDPTVNHMDRSDAYWFREGWASFLAARRVKHPLAGRILETARAEAWDFPQLVAVVARRSRLDPTTPIVSGAAGLDALPPPDGGYTDLATLLVRYLQGKHRADLERFLLSQVEGTRKGVAWFEECFTIRGPADWRKLENAVYDSIDRE